MSYFNHAFQKCFLGTGLTRNNSAPVAGVNIQVGAETPLNPWSDDGFITTSLSPTLALANTGPGYFGFYNKDTYQSLAEADLVSGECCPLVLAAASLKMNDMQGKFHGGYQESNKSKFIKPNLISQYYRVDQCSPQQNIMHIGDTNFTGSAPGAVDTQMLKQSLERNVDGAKIARERLISRTPMKHLASPDEIAKSVIFLLDCDRSPFLTGQTLVVDGGALAQLSTE